MNFFKNIFKKNYDILTECTHCQIMDGEFKKCDDCGHINVCKKCYDVEKLCYNCNNHYNKWIKSIENEKINIENKYKYNCAGGELNHPLL